MNFTAFYIEPRKDAAFAELLLADPETDPDAPSVLIFSRPIEFADSDYYFEVNDQFYGSYGGLELVQLSPNGLKVTLKPETVKKFGEEAFAQIDVAFEPDHDTYQTIVAVLSEIFAGSDVLVLV